MTHDRIQGLQNAIVSLLLWGLFSTGDASELRQPTNESEIAFFNEEDGYATCRAKGDENLRLADIRLSEQDVRTRVWCIVGDLDGNGYFDFVFRGKFDKEAFWRASPGEPRFKLEPLIKVIFFEKARILKTQILKNHGKDHIAIYEPTTNTGEFGEPPTELVGLIQYGEGGDTYIYLYDPETGYLKRSTYESEWH